MRRRTLLLMLLLASCGGETAAPVVSAVDEDPVAPSASDAPALRPYSGVAHTEALPTGYEPAWIARRSPDGAIDVVLGGHRAHLAAGVVSWATDDFAAPIASATEVADGWLFVAEDGAVASAGDFTGVLAAQPSIPEPLRLSASPSSADPAIRLAGTFPPPTMMESCLGPGPGPLWPRAMAQPRSRGRAAVVDAHGVLWTGVARGPLVRLETLGQVVSAVFVDTDHGAALVNGGVIAVTSDGARTWRRLRGIATATWIALHAPAGRAPAVAAVVEEGTPAVLGDPSGFDPNVDPDDLDDDARRTLRRGAYAHEPTRLRIDSGGTRFADGTVPIVLGEGVELYAADTGAFGRALPWPAGWTASGWGDAVLLACGDCEGNEVFATRDGEHFEAVSRPDVPASPETIDAAELSRRAQVARPRPRREREREHEREREACSLPVGSTDGRTLVAYCGGRYRATTNGRTWRTLAPGLEFASLHDTRGLTDMPDRVALVDLTTGRARLLTGAAIAAVHGVPRSSWTDDGTLLYGRGRHAAVVPVSGEPVEVSLQTHLGTLTSISGPDAQHLVAYGTRGIASTEDGRTWTLGAAGHAAPLAATPLAPPACELGPWVDGPTIIDGVRATIEAVEGDAHGARRVRWTTHDAAGEHAHDVTLASWPEVLAISTAGLLSTTEGGATWTPGDGAAVSVTVARSTLDTIALDGGSVLSASLAQGSDVGFVSADVATIQLLTPDGHVTEATRAVVTAQVGLPLLVLDDHGAATLAEPYPPGWQDVVEVGTRPACTGPRSHAALYVLGPLECGGTTAPARVIWRLERDASGAVCAREASGRQVWLEAEGGALVGWSVSSTATSSLRCPR